MWQRGGNWISYWLHYYLLPRIFWISTKGYCGARGWVRDQPLRFLAASIQNDQINGYKEHSVYASKLCIMQVELDTHRTGPQAAVYGSSTQTAQVFNTAIKPTHISSHSVIPQGCSSVWILWCLMRDELHLKLFPHSSHSLPLTHTQSSPA